MHPISAHTLISRLAAAHNPTDAPSPLNHTIADVLIDLRLIDTNGSHQRALITLNAHLPILFSVFKSGTMSAKNVTEVVKILRKVWGNFKSECEYNERYTRFRLAPDVQDLIKQIDLKMQDCDFWIKIQDGFDFKASLPYFLAPRSLPDTETLKPTLSEKDLFDLIHRAFQKDPSPQENLSNEDAVTRLRGFTIFMRACLAQDSPLTVQTHQIAFHSIMQYIDADIEALKETRPTLNACEKAYIAEQYLMMSFLKILFNHKLDNTVGVRVAMQMAQQACVRFEASLVDFMNSQEVMDETKIAHIKIAYDRLISILSVLVNKKVFPKQVLGAQASEPAVILSAFQLLSKVIAGLRAYLPMPDHPVQRVDEFRVSPTYLGSGARAAGDDSTVGSRSSTPVSGAPTSASASNPIVRRTYTV